jgi:hypothetical protein
VFIIKIEKYIYIKCYIDFNLMEQPISIDSNNFTQNIENILINLNDTFLKYNSDTYANADGYTDVFADSDADDIESARVAAADTDAELKYKVIKQYLPLHIATIRDGFNKFIKHLSPTGKRKSNEPRADGTFKDNELCSLSLNLVDEHSINKCMRHIILYSGCEKPDHPLYEIWINIDINCFNYSTFMSSINILGASKMVTAIKISLCNLTRGMDIIKLLPDIFISLGSNLYSLDISNLNYITDFQQLVKYIRILKYLTFIDVTHTKYYDRDDINDQIFDSIRDSLDRNKLDKYAFSFYQ